MNSPKIIYIRPTIENCDPIKKYQISTPVQYSLQENPILYGGGRKWLISCSSPDFISSITGQDSSDLLVDLFAFNTSFIIWFNGLEKGLEISYLDIPAHAVRKNQLGQLELYIQMNYSNSGDQSPCLIEFSFTPKYWENDRYFNQEIEKLFTYEFFGLNKGSKMIFNTFNAIGKCSCFHNNNSDDYDDERSMDDADEVIDEFYEMGLDNSGNADDMTDTNEGEIKWNSGVNVKIYNDEEKFKTRSLEELGIVSSEAHESNKRIRC